MAADGWNQKRKDNDGAVANEQTRLVNSQGPAGDGVVQDTVNTSSHEIDHAFSCGMLIDVPTPRSSCATHAPSPWLATSFPSENVCADVVEDEPTAGCNWRYYAGTSYGLILMSSLTYWEREYYRLGFSLDRCLLIFFSFYFFPQVLIASLRENDDIWRPR